MEQVILVNENDEVLGHMNKMEAHQKGVLHRAFSIFIFNTQGQMLLQRRALTKYHSAGLWSNTCCSHPRPNENTVEAAQRRLKEEMGLECELRPVYSFQYKVEFENGLTENELDHVLVGITNLVPTLDKEEAMEWKYEDTSSIETAIQQTPEKFTFWFALCFSSLIQYLNNHQSI